MRFYDQKSDLWAVWSRRDGGIEWDCLGSYCDPIFHAAKNGHLRILKNLLDLDVDGHYNNLWDAFDVAAEEGHTAIVAYILCLTTRFHATPVYGNPELFDQLTASEFGDWLETLQILPDKTIRYGLQPGAGQNAMSPTAIGCCALLTRLFQHCSTCECTQEAMFIAAEGSLLHEAAYGDHLSTIELLISYGADVNAQNSGGSTALHAAIRGNNVESAQLLIDYGANIDLHSPNRNSAFLEAVFAGNDALVRLLLENGANPNALGKGD
ncbi:ankyrin repeat-containing protein 18 [Elsinoe australis]|uniref:Ankyrin repeat-containing protein 18 n=1 Tax=Elsinoe australis TaxID=40998 RepID=A0A4U7AYY8_9PEZI|nr:ankyrin repeat-containing protein 18 [Elsinoe australis]